MFIAHVNDLQPNHYKVIKQARSIKVLLNDGVNYLLQDNICPHQGSRIRTDGGKGLTAVCPFHGWSWDSDGNPKGSGTTSCKNDSNLRTFKLHEWNGFLFSRPVPDGLPDIKGNYGLVEYRTDRIAANAVTVMDLFLDVDHIPVVHPKLYDQIDIPRVDDIVWQSWNGGSAQMVPGVKDVNSEWNQFVKDRNLSHSALWLAFYPGTQFEWQPGGVFVQVNETVDDETTVSHIFKYRDFSYPERNWEINDRVWEEAWRQDKQQSELLEPGWINANPNHLEPEKLAFRSWLRDNKLI